MRCLGLLVLMPTLVLAQGPPVSPGAGAGPTSPSPTQPLAPRLSPDLKIPDFKFQGGSPSENAGASRPLDLLGLKFEPALANERPQQANPLRCAIPLLEMKPPQGVFMPKAVLPPIALNDRIAIPPPVPACPQ
jgi:hypothetical protein